MVEHKETNKVAAVAPEQETKALKLLKLDTQMDGFPITSLREILILKQLNHPSIVRLEDVFHFNTSSVTQLHQSEYHQSPKWKKNMIYMVFEHVPHDLMGLVDYGPKWAPDQLKCLL